MMEMRRRFAPAVRQIHECIARCLSFDPLGLGDSPACS
jgi:hypothetical protein